MTGTVGGGLQVQDLSVGYGADLVLHGASFDAARGAITGLVGPNGAGKSTALKAVLGLVALHGGLVTFDGAPIAGQRARVAYVPQRSGIDWDYPAVVHEVVGMGRYPHRTRWGRPRDRHADRRLVADALARVRLSELAGRQIGELSGGQQQRIFLARALAQEAELVLLDEPFAGVDAVTEELMWTELGRLRDEGRAVVVVNHDLASVTARFDALVLLARRVVASGPTADVFTAANVAASYGSVPALVDFAGTAP
jgi:ABC-type Mn2+/Zn2+ transport system ATPase subunit